MSNSHQKHVLAHVEAVTGLHNSELAPELVRLFIREENRIMEMLENDCGAFGRNFFILIDEHGESPRFSKNQFYRYLDNKGYYTSPLYKALL